MAEPKACTRTGVGFTEVMSSLTMALLLAAKYSQLFTTPQTCTTKKQARRQLKDLAQGSGGSC